jgi:hypothetical protein
MYFVNKRTQVCYQIEFRYHASGRFLNFEKFKFKKIKLRYSRPPPPSASRSAADQGDGPHDEAAQIQKEKGGGEFWGASREF